MISATWRHLSLLRRDSLDSGTLKWQKAPWEWFSGQKNKDDRRVKQSGQTLNNMMKSATWPHVLILECFSDVGLTNTNCCPVSPQVWRFPEAGVMFLPLLPRRCTMASPPSPLLHPGRAALPQLLPRLVRLPNTLPTNLNQNHHLSHFTQRSQPAAQLHTELSPVKQHPQGWDRGWTGWYRPQ